MGDSTDDRPTIDIDLTPLVVGIDLSLTGTGLADTAGHVERIGSQPVKAATWHDRHQRLLDLVERIETWPWSHGRPDLIVIEGPSYASRAQAGVWDRAGLFWAVYDRLAACGVDIAVVPPANRMIYATGKGQAPKAAVVEAVTRRFGRVWASLGSDDVADACVLAAMGAAALGHPLARLPQSHARGLTGVAEWSHLRQVVAAS